MKVCIVGGTGLLGSESARELIARGHQVRAAALPPLPQGAVLPPEMEIVWGNCLAMSGDELRAMFAGCEGFLFAAGIDERVEGPAPIYELYKKYNIDLLERLLLAAKECGVKHCVVFGSYFEYFDRLWPQKRLAEIHPYIRSRRDQEALAMKFAGPDFDVAVLELPYIFGTQPGRRPVWVFLAESIRKMKPFTFWPKGGSAMVTVRQVGQAAAGALERSRGGKCWPIGWYNLTWKEMLRICHGALGCPEKKILSVPKWMFTLAAVKLRHDQKARGIEGGLQLVRFAELQCAELFIGRELGCVPLGVQADDLPAAICDSMRLSAEILDGAVKDVVPMKGE